MPPRAPVVWTTKPVRGERLRRRLDERHHELTIEARSTARRYRASRSAPGSAGAVRSRTHFLASLGRLSSFEAASLRLAICRFDVQVRAHADDLTRDYFELWQVMARRGSETPPDEQRASERLDHFAVQLGRLEGLADALFIAGRNVRLFPLPAPPWTTVEPAAEPMRRRARG